MNLNRLKYHLYNIPIEGRVINSDYRGVARYDFGGATKLGIEFKQITKTVSRATDPRVFAAFVSANENEAVGEEEL